MKQKLFLLLIIFLALRLNGLTEEPKKLGGAMGTVNNVDIKPEGTMIAIQYGKDQTHFLLIKRDNPNYSLFHQTVANAYDSRRVITVVYAPVQKDQNQYPPWEGLITEIQLSSRVEGPAGEPGPAKPQASKLPKDCLDISRGFTGPVYIKNTHPSRRIRYSVTITKGFSPAGSVEGVVGPGQSNYIGQARVGDSTLLYSVASASYDSPE